MVHRKGRWRQRSRCPDEMTLFLAWRCGLYLLLNRGEGIHHDWYGLLLESFLYELLLAKDFSKGYRVA